jgi:hypothetical protein
LLLTLRALPVVRRVQDMKKIQTGAYSRSPNSHDGY